MSNSVKTPHTVLQNWCLFGAATEKNGDQRLGSQLVLVALSPYVSSGEGGIRTHGRG